MSSTYITPEDAAEVCEWFGDKLKAEGRYLEAAAVYSAGKFILAGAFKYATFPPEPGQTPVDPWEAAAKARGWIQFACCVGRPDNIDRTYEDWKACCIGESIHVPMKDAST